MDPFATLGIERSYELDLRALEKTHRELSRALHPDRYISTPPSERREALAKAVEVNEAWRIVRDPIRRAEALLSLIGVVVDEQGESVRDLEFLEELLERREALSHARRAGDRRAVRALAETVRAQSGEAERELSLGLATGVRAPLADALGKMKFYRRVLDEVSAIEDELV